MNSAQRHQLPMGFRAAGVCAGIKGRGSKLDLALLVSDRPASAAGVFTTNRVQAPCVLYTRERVRAGKLQALVINSGSANACTGEQGMRDTQQMALWTAAQLNVPAELVAVASTGVVGVPLPMPRIQAGIEQAVTGLGPDHVAQAAEAIMTTDTHAKLASTHVKLPGCARVQVSAIAKGSGMIHPNLATMLAFVMTDAAVPCELLQAMVRQAADVSFNMISVDGDTSTNDMVVALANGAAMTEPVQAGSADAQALQQALDHVLIDLAKQIARDGEGATKLLEVHVEQAASVEDARRAARAVVRSNLVKAAVFGEDANWGRVIVAMGNSGADWDPAKVDLFLGDLQVVRAGAGMVFDEERARAILHQPTVEIRARLHQGHAHATAWGCDLTYDYVKINADYRT